MPEISAVILTYNSIKFIKPCLDSLFAQDYRDFEVIIVDNGSNDETASFIRDKYPQVRLVKNKENLGAAKGRNQGIEIAGGKWVLTLDCDVMLENDFLKRIMQFAKESEDSIGMFQPKILRDNKQTIYSCGIHLSCLRRFHDIGKDSRDNGRFDKPRYIFGACSAAALYKKEMLEEIKEKNEYFDERFFFLVEDVDLSWRAQKKGWQCIFYPNAICYHKGNSSEFNSITRKYFCFRNRYFMILKNEKLNNTILKLPFCLIYDLPRLFYLLLNKNLKSHGLMSRTTYD
jgi:GT2 family glycosyltransferase